MKPSHTATAPVRRRRGRLGVWLASVVTFALIVAACTITTEAPSTNDPPAVTITSPTNGASTSQARVDVSGFVQSSHPIASVRVTNGAHSASCIFSGDQFVCSNVPLTIGSNTITVRATNDVGLADSDFVTVNRADSLTASIERITDASTPEVDQVRLDGSFTSPTTVTSVRAASDAGPDVSCTIGSDATYSCPGVPISTGVTRLQVTVASDDNDVTRAVRLQGFGASDASGFDIALVYFDEAYTESQIAAFATAASRWTSIITGDAEDATIDPSQFSDGPCALGEPDVDVIVDDLLIFVTSYTEREGGTLGLATPCLIRTLGSVDPNINLVGYMEFDTLDVDQLENDGQWEATIVHEMGHVLGVGTNWEFSRLDLLDYTTEDGNPCRLTTGFIEPPVYTGAEGVAAYADLGGTGDVPVEEEGGSGTRCGHWDEETFHNELMTGFLDPGDNPLSELTARSLRDLGYTVDTTATDPYSLPNAGALRPASVLDIGEREILLPPRGTVDPATGRFEPLGPTAP